MSLIQLIQKTNVDFPNFERFVANTKPDLSLQNQAIFLSHSTSKSVRKNSVEKIILQLTRKLKHSVTQIEQLFRIGEPVLAGGTNGQGYAGGNYSETDENSGSLDLQRITIRKIEDDLTYVANNPGIDKFIDNIAKESLSKIYQYEIKNKRTEFIAAKINQINIEITNEEKRNTKGIGEILWNTINRTASILTILMLLSGDAEAPELEVAEPSQNDTVCARNGLNLRDGPNVNSRKINAVPYGAKVKIVGQEGHYTKIVYPMIGGAEIDGYVSTRWLCGDLGEKSQS